MKNHEVNEQFIGLIDSTIYIYIYIYIIWGNHICILPVYLSYAPFSIPVVFSYFIQK